MNAVETTALPGPGRSWRDIRQEVQPTAMSRKGRRRQLAASAKVAALLALGVAGLWAVYYVADSWTTDRASLATAVHSDPVRTVALVTDGFLARDWAREVLAVPKSASLMALDLPALRDRLLAATGQVRMATLTRSFPETLVITLQERTPVVRLQAAEADGTTRQLLVAKDGVVYAGLNYDQKFLATLPWLDGVRLVRTPAGYEPIPGLADVAALLTKAQLEAPHLYRDWVIVSLARLAAADEIVVTGADKRQITFSRNLDYFKQLALLDAVSDRIARQAPDVGVQSVNLTLGNQVPVVLARTPDELAAEPPPNFSLPTLQRKEQRDL